MGERISNTYCQAPKAGEIALAAACDHTEENRIKLRILNLEKQVKFLVEYCILEPLPECIKDLSNKNLMSIDKQYIKTLNELGNSVEKIATKLNLDELTISNILKEV